MIAFYTKTLVLVCEGVTPMRISLFPLIVVILGLAACNSKPMIEPSTPLTSSQLKSPNQWALLASQTADELAPTLSKIKRPAYIAGDEDSKFVATFRDLLSEELTVRGITVASHASNAAIINVSTSVVRMRHPRKPPFPLGAVELAVAVPVEVTTGMVTYLAAAPDTEVVVSITMLDDQRLWFRKYHIFYVDGGETNTYRSLPSNMMTDWQGSRPAKVLPVAVSSN